MTDMLYAMVFWCRNRRWIGSWSGWSKRRIRSRSDCRTGGDGNASVACVWSAAAALAPVGVAALTSPAVASGRVADTTITQIVAAVRAVIARVGGRGFGWRRGRGSGLRGLATKDANPTEMDIPNEPFGSQEYDSDVPAAHI